MAKRPKRPRDFSQAAKLVVEIASGEVKDQEPNSGKNPAAVELGRKGGLKGGKARAKTLSPQQRSESSKKAAKARWTKREP
jgi:hypothetical protein